MQACTWSCRIFCWFARCAASRSLSTATIFALWSCCIFFSALSEATVAACSTIVETFKHQLVDARRISPSENPRPRPALRCVPLNFFEALRHVTSTKDTTRRFRPTWVGTLQLQHTHKSARKRTGSEEPKRGCSSRSVDISSTELNRVLKRACGTNTATCLH
jgi:hypothetical protein